ncbi:MAG: proline iminopeptidase [Polyangiales bacterium]
MSSLFPAIEAYETGMLEVGDGHTLYYEQSGNPNGKPAIFVHGGPGGGTDPSSRRYWDPAHYRIVLFDQRGCGESTPHANLHANTTQHLIADMEKLRAHLSIDTWQVFGGSWGSTLSLAYAEVHPEHVSELILRGIFLVRPEEIHWYYQEGTSRIFPDAWEGFLAPIPEAERGDLVSAYHKRLTSDDEAIRNEAALAWSIWEGSTSRLIPDPEMVARTAEPVFAAAFARIECHYFMNKGFMDENQLLRDIDKIRHIPCVIVQGRYDVICPTKSAWDLHRAFPESKLVLVPDAGHSARESGIQAALLEATEDYK